MNMIWQSEHGKTFDVPFSESDSFLELKRIIKNHSDFLFYLSGEDPRFYKRGIGQYPARLSGGGVLEPSSCNAQCSGNTKAFLVKSRTSRRSLSGE